MNALNLKQNFAWTFAGQVAVALAHLLVLTLIARQFSSDYVGQYAFALAICSPVVIFAALQLRSVQATDSLGEFLFVDYFALRAAAMVFAFIVITMIALFVRGWGESGLLIIVLGAAKCIDSLGDVIHGFHQRHERMDRVSISFIIRSVTLILLFASGLLTTGSLVGGVFGILVSSFFVLWVVDFPLWNRTYRSTSNQSSIPLSPTWILERLRLSVSFQRLLRLLRLSLPLGFTSSISSVATSVPRYFLDFAHGASLLGVFAALIYPLTAGNMIMSAIAQSAAPRLSNYYRNGQIGLFQRFLMRLILLGVGLAIAGVFAAVLIGRFLLEILYGVEYVQYHWIFVWGMVNAGIGYCYLFLGSALNAMRLFRVQLPIHLSSLAVLSLACLFLIKPHGLEGAMMSLTIAAVVESVLYGGIVIRSIRREIQSATTSI